MNLLIITCEIDQFLLVTRLVNNISQHIEMISLYCKNKITGIYCKKSSTKKYIPKEIFNMTQIKAINFTLFSAGNMLIYNKTSLSLNHYSCKWNNLIKLTTSYNLDFELHEQLNKNLALKY